MPPSQRRALGQGKTQGRTSKRFRLLEVLAAIIGALALLLGAVRAWMLDSGSGKPPQPGQRTPGGVSAPPSSHEGQPHVKLDNKINCVLLDRLAGVARIHLPPVELSLRATMTGIVGSQRPIQVVVLYKNAQGNLSASVLKNASRISRIDGHAPFLAFVPDRESTLDNHGSASLEFFQARNLVKSEVLDPVHNAVLLDQLPEAVTIDRPANGYRMLASGSLGSASLAPMALVSYRDYAARVERVAILRQGDRLPNIDRRVRVIAVVLDWYSSEDNSGEVTLLEDNSPVGVYHLVDPLDQP